VVIGWLTRIAVVLALLGVVGYDGISIIASRVGAPDDADGAAQAAASAWQQSHNFGAAEQQAAASLTSTEKLVPHSLTIAANGTVTLKIRRTVSTLVASHLPDIRKATAFVTTGSASAPTP
jgi:hypothetical protein